MWSLIYIYCRGRELRAAFLLLHVLLIGVWRQHWLWRLCFMIKVPAHGISELRYLLRVQLGLINIFFGSRAGLGGMLRQRLPHYILCGFVR